MFTWICPQCGHEVPPSESECPNCARLRQAQAQPPAAAPPPQATYRVPESPVPPPPPPPPYRAPEPPSPSQPAYAPPQQEYAPSGYQAQQQTQYAPPPQYQQPQASYPPPPPHYPQGNYAQPQGGYVLQEPKRGLPNWLVGLLVAAGLGAALFGLYYLVSGHSSTKTDQTAAATPSTPAATGAANAIANQLEITGLRLYEKQNKAFLKFAVINHSAGDLNDLQLRLTLTTKNAAAGEEPLAVITTKVASLPAYGLKDGEEAFPTKKRAYELPDWQFLKATLEVVDGGQ